jgi:hypothetical protein
MPTMKKSTYKQCGLQHPDGRMEVAWIPSKFCCVGEVVKIKRNGVWDDGWVVESVGFERPESDIISMHNWHKKHRPHTDVPQGTFK